MIMFIQISWQLGRNLPALSIASVIMMSCEGICSRYNVQQPESDIDAFIVYQAHTKDLLGFSPPKMTIKVWLKFKEFQPTRCVNNSKLKF